MDDAALLELPDDPILLKRMLTERHAAISQRDRLITERDTVISQRDTIIAQRDGIIAGHLAAMEQLQRESADREGQLKRESSEHLEQVKKEAADRITALQQQHKAEVDALLRRFYGPHSERFDPAQLLLFGITVETMPVDQKAVEKEAGQKLGTRKVGKRHNHGRGKLPAHLPRIRIEHDLTEEEKKCSCCGDERHCMGTQTSEQLEYVPAGFKVLEHVQYKYACKGCGEGKCAKCDSKAQIEMAQKPAQPIEKGLAGPGLLAHVAVSKLGDHLPLYRLEKIYARSGLDIARSTMCAWMAAIAALIKPLYELMVGRVKQSRVIHTDETRVPVQDEKVKGKCKSGRIWTYIGDRDHPYNIYEYTPDRTRAGPQRFLETYKGYLQADAYGGYDGVYHKGDCQEAACWAHARRKFFDARETDGRRSAEMLGMIQGLYKVEDEAQERIAEMKDGAGASACAPEQADSIRRELRQTRSKPILTTIKTWLDREKERVLPRSPMAGAIGYMLNQWDALNRYVEQGFLSIDNNAAERALKRVAIGRKNWLFAGSDEFGQFHAVIYTMIAGAERHGIDPQRYLTSVLAKIAGTPISELKQFLPDVWKREDQAASANGSSSNPPTSPSSANPR